MKAVLNQLKTLKTNATCRPPCLACHNPVHRCRCGSPRIHSRRHSDHQEHANNASTRLTYQTMCLRGRGRVRRREDYEDEDEDEATHCSHAFILVIMSGHWLATAMIVQEGGTRPVAWVKQGTQSDMKNRITEFRRGRGTSHRR